MNRWVFLLLLWATPASAWTDADVRLLQSLSLSRLKPLTPASFPTNRAAFSPAARELGQRLFFDENFSRDGKTSCAGCHRPELAFSSDRIVHSAHRGYRSTPTLQGAAWGRFYFWDGRRDSLWAQAASPLTNPDEHGLTKVEIARYVTGKYPGLYRRAFGAKRQTAEATVANVGKALAAFEATLTPSRSPLDDYVDAVRAGATRPVVRDFSACAERGLELFVGRGRCAQCHNGPRLTNEYFHNTGVPLRDQTDRADGQFVFVGDLKKDPFRCDGPHADGAGVAARCLHVETLPIEPRLAGAFKTPTLRKVRLTAPYMHNGVYATLGEVINHYDRADVGHLGSPEIFALALSSDEKAALKCLLEIL